MTYPFHVGNKTYDLRLTTRKLGELEDELGYNVLLVFGGETLPKTKDFITIIKYSMPNNIEEDFYDLFDKWLDAGHNFKDIIALCKEVFKASGLYTEKEEKNA